MIILTNTKEKIFDAAIEIISNIGFDCADMRSIAAKINIKAGSIYNHFNGKNEILDLIYEYYQEHFFDNLVEMDTIKSIIRNGTKYEIIDNLSFTFESSDQKKYVRMILISKIIYMRLFQDEKARAIFRKTTLDSINHVEALLNYGIEIKKFEVFDTKTFASLFVSSRHVMGITAFTDIDYTVRQLPEEKLINNHFAEMLPII